MKFFWFVILVLVATACGLSAARMNGIGGGETLESGYVLIKLPPMKVVERPVVVEPEPEIVIEPVLESVPEVVEPEPAVDTSFEDAMDAMIAGGSVKEAPVPVQVVEVVIGPSFEVLGDGSLIVGVTRVEGDGSVGRPFVIPWELLQTVGLEYEPREGKNDLPAWLDVIDGKRVRIAGNTLLPVVASSTKELLVMKNPWDGCCIGVPPTPFDAIEVRLILPVDFGSSSVGYGEVTGVFRVDPYVVSGWVMGLFVIDEGAYKSSPGTALPAF